MNNKIKHGLVTIGDASDIQSIQLVTGGDINQAFRVQTKDNVYFVKGNHNVSENFFAIEAQGLKLIDETNSIGVPHVYYYDQPKNDDDAIMIMEWVEGQKKKDTNAKLGTQLGHMHLTTNDQYGFNENTFIGTLPQPNDLFDNWIDYYRDQRLLTQYNIAIDKGRMSSIRRDKMEKLLQNLDNLLDRQPKSSLLHGDLWGGNWLTGSEGAPYLIDPSVFYGDHAFELAFTELFGGFSLDFYEAYNSVFPLPSYYEEIKPIYQLYYLLVHLNMFGESYGNAVDQILNRYVKG
ncbi:fructosamine kinase family protein [Aquibacillus rhizosphaerae]|uniref:Fructosamine kinase family protein n=1 Tax=Aquibacillus rhizosphaerae TaxID=3051431 RepID=A0ABT7L778_9BACI|nr:fructosamine kinase family protein [Aquibacillus sp. LR5S19]MDL4841709.1 fructosamine kinase family protein [Aquibacillus sp. LR5S19]